MTVWRPQHVIQVKAVGHPIVLENIYEHHGVTGHEVLFLSDVLFPDDAYRDQDCIAYQEDTGEACRARWFDIDTLDRGGMALYPSGLKDALEARAAKPQS